MIFYMGLGVAVWFPAFLIATFMLGKLSKSEGARITSRLIQAPRHHQSPGFNGVNLIRG
jgi:hypothetical protein